MFSVYVSSIPDPGSFTLFGSALSGLVTIWLRKRMSFQSVYDNTQRRRCLAAGV
jgi:hypothetical protein